MAGNPGGAGRAGFTLAMCLFYCVTSYAGMEATEGLLRGALLVMFIFSTIATLSTFVLFLKALDDE